MQFESYLGLSVLFIVVSLGLLFYLVYRKGKVLKWLASTNYTVTALVSMNKNSGRYIQHTLVPCTKDQSVMEIMFSYTMVTTYMEGGEMRIQALGVLRIQSAANLGELEGWIARWMLYRTLISRHYGGADFAVKNLAIDDVDYFVAGQSTKNEPQLLSDYHKGYYS